MTVNPADRTKSAMKGTRLDVLVAMFQGGGNVHLIMPIVDRLVGRGHHVRVLVGPGVRGNRQPISSGFIDRVHASGAKLIQMPDPESHPFDTARPLRGLIRGWTPSYLRLIPPSTRPNLWSPIWATAVRKQLRHIETDIVASDYVLLGALAAAEAAGVPNVALVHQGYYPFQRETFHPTAPGQCRLADRSAGCAIRFSTSRVAVSTSATGWSRSIGHGSTWDSVRCDRRWSSMTVPAGSYSLVAKRLTSRARTFR